MILWILVRCFIWRRKIVKWRGFCREEFGSETWRFDSGVSSINAQRFSTFNASISMHKWLWRGSLKEFATNFPFLDHVELSNFKRASNEILIFNFMKFLLSFIQITPRNVIRLIIASHFTVSQPIWILTAIYCQTSMKFLPSNTMKWNNSWERRLNKIIICSACILFTKPANRYP